MSTLFIDRRDIQIEHDSGALIVRERGERIATVPLAPITRVVLRSSAQLTANVLATLGERGVGVILLSGRLGHPTLFFSRPHSDAHLRVQQVRASLDAAFCLEYARHLVHTKLHSQINWLEQLRQERAQQRYALTHARQLLQEHARAVDRAGSLESLRGVEGAAASAYFAGLRAVVPGSLEFHERNRRPPRDPFNTLLSLTYTLVHAEAAFHLHAVGLDPQVGYYHQISHARESLACDLMETMRPLADRIALHMVTTQWLTAEHFSTTSGGCLLGKAGRTRYYSAYEEQASALRHTLRHQVQALVQRIDPHHPAPAWATLPQAEPLPGAQADSSADAST